MLFLRCASPCCIYFLTINSRVWVAVSLVFSHTRSNQGRPSLTALAELPAFVVAMMTALLEPMMTASVMIIIIIEGPEGDERRTKPVVAGVSTVDIIIVVAVVVVAVLTGSAMTVFA